MACNALLGSTKSGFVTTATVEACQGMIRGEVTPGEREDLEAWHGRSMRRSR